MNIDSDTVSGWFVSSAGKVYAKCPVCHSSHLTYHKTRVSGLRGISISSKGITPACMACGKNMPTLKPLQQRLRPKKINKVVLK